MEYEAADCWQGMAPEQRCHVAMALGRLSRHLGC
jgi:hypothetical protein